MKVQKYVMKEMIYILDVLEINMWLKLVTKIWFS